MDSSVLLRAEYQQTVRIKHLSMEPSLQGESMEFRFEDHDVKVSLPNLSFVKSQEGFNEFMEAEADCWDKNGEILRVCVYAIHVAILNLKFEIPATAAMVKGINATLIPEDERKHLDERTDALYFLARRALKYWLEVLRWKTGLALIDLDTRPRGPSLRGARLINMDHGGAFYSPRVTRTLTARKMYRLDLETWQAVFRSLKDGDEVPIWSIYLMSAHQRIEVGDYRTASIELAIAAKSVFLRFFDKAVLPHAPKWVYKKFEKPKMSELLGLWNLFGLPDKLQLTWFKTIVQLNDVRNGVMHRGDDQKANNKFCKCAASAVEHLITLLESRLS